MILTYIVLGHPFRCMGRTMLLRRTKVTWWQVCAAGPARRRVMQVLSLRGRAQPHRRPETRFLLLWITAADGGEAVGFTVGFAVAVVVITNDVPQLIAYPLMVRGGGQSKDGCSVLARRSPSSHAAPAAAWSLLPSSLPIAISWTDPLT